MAEFNPKDFRLQIPDYGYVAAEMEEERQRMMDAADQIAETRAREKAEADARAERAEQREAAALHLAKRSMVVAVVSLIVGTLLSVAALIVAIFSLQDGKPSAPRPTSQATITPTPSSPPAATPTSSTPVPSRT